MASSVIGDLFKSGAEAVGKGWSRLWEAEASKGVIQSGESALKRFGPFGDTLAESLKSYQDKSGARIGEILQHRIPLFNAARRSGVGNEVINDLKRSARAVHPDARNLANYDRLLNEALYQEAGSHGIKVGPRVPDDFHHMYDAELFKGKKIEDQINHLVNTGQAATRSEAKDLLNKIRPGIGRGKVHTLETGRVIQLPSYRQDLAVMQDHFVGAIRRFTAADTFGPKDEVLHGIIDQIEKAAGPGAARQAKLIAANILGRGIGTVDELGNIVGNGFYRKLASVETLTHLSLAWMKHTGQFLNSVVVGGRSGLQPIIKATFKSIADHGNANSFAIRTGAVNLQVIHDVRRLAGAEAETLGSKLLRYTPFKFMDKARRVFATQMGTEAVKYDYERFLLDPKNPKPILNLRLMGLDPHEIQKVGGLNADHLVQAAKRMSDLTQFESNALTLPPSWVNSDNPGLRMMVMFKQFFFHQARFVKDQVLKPAILDGEFKPLIYMSLLFPTLGEVVADANVMARKGNLKDRPGGSDPLDPKHWADRLIDNYAAVGGLGIMHDLVQSFAQPDETAAFRFAVGPVISDVIDLSHMPFTKHPIHEVEKRIERSIPVIGPILSHKLNPPARPAPKGPLQRGVVTRTIYDAVKKITE